MKMGSKARHLILPVPIISFFLLLMSPTEERYHYLQWVVYTTHRDQHSTWSKVFSTTKKILLKNIFCWKKMFKNLFKSFKYFNFWFVDNAQTFSSKPSTPLFLFPWPVLCLGFGLEISWYQKQLPCIKAHQEPEKKT